MKVLQVIPYLGIGGAEHMCEAIVYGLLHLDVDVKIISLYTIHTILTMRMEAKGIKIIYLDKHKGLDVSQYKKLIRLVKYEKPDIIHTHLGASLYVFPVASFCGIPCVHTVHNVAEKENDKINRIFNSLFFKYSKVFPVAISNMVQKSIYQVYGISNKNLAIIYNGIILDKISGKKNYVLGNEINILHIGRLTDQKNQQAIIMAMCPFLKKNPKVRLRFLGDGELMEYLRKQVEEYQLSEQILFCGNQEDVNSFLSISDIFILLSKYEGFPLSLIEAMASGLPSLVTAVGGIPDIAIDNKNALYVQLDLKDVIPKLERLLSSLSLREKIGKCAMETANQYSHHKMAAEYMSLYYKILKNS